MLLRKHYDILLVDPEPQVLEQTAALLQAWRCDGVPLRILPCRGKAEAVALLTNASTPLNIATAIINPRLETENAGLELCNVVRGELRNRLTQIILLGDHPFPVSEREMVDRYDACACLPATTADARLYPVLKAATRQFDCTRLALFFSQLYAGILPGFRSPVDLVAALRSFLEGVHRDPRGGLLSGVELHVCFTFDYHELGVGMFQDPEEITAARSRLSLTEQVVLNEAGDTFRMSQGGTGIHDAALRLNRTPGAKGKTMGSIELMARVAAPPPDLELAMWHRALYSLRRLLAISEFVDNLLVESRLDKAWTT